MVKVRVLRPDGVWRVAVIPFTTYLYGKFWLTFSEVFRKGANMLSIKLLFPWDEKYLKKS